MEIMKLFFTRDEDLYDKTIEDVFDDEVFGSTFWLYWRTMFAFETWHSALEMKLYFQRFIHHIGGLPDFSALKFTKYNQYDSLILPMQRYLENAGVQFQFNTRVTNVLFDIEGAKKTAKKIVAPIAFGPVQFRISEALCVLPYFLPSAVPGVTIGCFLANLLCGAAPLDVVFGSLATLIGAVGSYYLGKKSKWLVCVPPILANTIIIPWVLRYAYGSTDLIPYAMVTVGIGEILAIGVLGNILLLALERSHRAVFAQ